MLIAAALLLALQAGALPPPPPAAEHAYNPGTRTVHTTYTCMDGARSVTLQYEQVPKGRVTSMSRNNRLASPKVVEEVNRLIGRFAQIAGVYPQCGRTDDSLFVSGLLASSGRRCGSLGRTPLYICSPPKGPISDPRADLDLVSSVRERSGFGGQI